ncbi:hypothetical protein LINGRAHAP2_LOCUS23275, partial [Linum grandiflorum]
PPPILHPPSTVLHPRSSSTSAVGFRRAVGALPHCSSSPVVPQLILPPSAYSADSSSTAPQTTMIQIPQAL